MNADLADLHFQGDSGWVMLAVSSAETRESMQVVFPQSARFKGGKMLETRSRPVRLAVMVFVCCTEAECVFFFFLSLEPGSGPWEKSHYGVNWIVSS